MWSGKALEDRHTLGFHGEANARWVFPQPQRSRGARRKKLRRNRAARAPKPRDIGDIRLPVQKRKLKLERDDIARCGQQRLGTGQRYLEDALSHFAHHKRRGQPRPQRLVALLGVSPLSSDGWRDLQRHFFIGPQLPVKVDAPDAASQRLDLPGVACGGDVLLDPYDVAVALFGLRAAGGKDACRA